MSAYLIAENEVAECLKRKGWKVVARNFRRRGTEIDIIAIRGTTLVFVEVKWRKSKQKELSCALCDYLPLRKRRALLKGAAIFCREQENSVDWDTTRLDLAVVSPGYSDFTFSRKEGLSVQYFRNV